MNHQDMIERDVRLALGDLTLQLIVARAEAANLREQLESMTPDRKQAKPNGKDKPDAQPDSRSQPN